MSRILQAAGAEVIHLGPTARWTRIVTAAVEEDCTASPCPRTRNAGTRILPLHADRLRERGAGNIKVFGGGGGVIVPAEIAALHASGVARILFAGRRCEARVKGMIADMMRLADADLTCEVPADLRRLASATAMRSRGSSRPRSGVSPSRCWSRRARARAYGHGAPVSVSPEPAAPANRRLTDELNAALRLDQEDGLEHRHHRGGPVAAPHRRRAAGRPHPHERIGGPKVYMRSLATRDNRKRDARLSSGRRRRVQGGGVRSRDRETPGIGQGDTGIRVLADVSLYVMTPEYGAPSQLEKIDMLDFADFVVINKFDRRGAEDAMRDVRKTGAAKPPAFGERPEDMPGFGTIAARFTTTARARSTTR